MRIVGIYSLKQGREVVEAKFAQELQEIQSIVATIDSSQYLTKVSKEKTDERKGVVPSTLVEYGL